MSETTAGEAVARLRFRRRMTQEQLAEAAGLSVAAVRAIEQGAREGRMSTLSALARALGVRTSDLLVPERGAPVVHESQPDALLAVRRVLSPPLGLPPPEPDKVTSVDAWQRTLAYGERLYDEDNYDAVLESVPALLDEAYALHAAGVDGGAEAYAQAHLYAAQLLTQVRQLDLANHALGKAMDLAGELSDELLAAYVVTIQCWTLLLQRRFPEVETLAVQTAERIEPQMSSRATRQLATWGWLMARASAAAVRDARTDDAEDYMSQARTAAARLDGHVWATGWSPPPVRGFCETLVGFKTVENAVLVGDHGKALTLADRLPPSTVPTVNNQCRHRLDIASSQLATHQPAEAIETLLNVREAAPEWLRHQGYGRALIGQLVEQRRRAYADEVSVLADHVGVTA